MKKIRPVKDCPYCGTESLIFDSRPMTYGIYRRRECPKCKYRFTTVEIDYDSYMQIENKVKQGIKILNKIKLLARSLEEGLQ